MPPTDPELFLPPLEARLARLTPATERRWGQMNAHEMICHLSDSFLAMLGEREVERSSGWSPFRQTFTRFVALQTP